VIAWMLLGLATAAEPSPDAPDDAEPTREAASCEALDPVRFRDLVLQLQASIDRGNLELSEQVVATMRHEIPCLTHAPRTRQWAAYLVGEAIVRFARGEPWQPQMATALRTYPAVDRGVAARHPLASWEPPPPSSPGPPVPRGGPPLYVDGFPAERLPPPGELHLVQRTDGRFWNSVLVEPDAPLPAGWARQEVVEPPRVSSWVALSGGIGVGSVQQQPGFDTDWVQSIDPGDRAAGYVSLDLQGAATFYSPFGVWARAGATTWSASPGLDAAAAGIWTWNELMVGVGAGTTSIDTFQGPADGSDLARDLPDEEELHRIYLPRYALATVQLRAGAPDRFRVHATLVLGSGNRVGRGLAELYASPAGDGPGRWRMGLSLATASAVLTEQRRPNNLLETGSTRATVHLGRAWGEY